MAEHFNASPFVIGLLISAMSLTTAAVSSQLGKIYKLAPLVTIIAGSFSLYGIAFIMIPLMPEIGLILIPIAVFGIAHGGNIPGLQTGVAGLAPLEHRAAFMSLNATVLRLGQTIGPPVMTLIYLQEGLDITFFISGAIAFMVALTPFLYSTIRGRKT